MKPKIKFRSVRTRQIFWFLIVGLLPLIIVSFVIYTQRVKSIKEEGFHKLIAIRDLKVEQINSWLDERIGDIKTISEDSHLKALENTLKKDIRLQDGLDIILNARIHLNRYLKNYRDYHEIFIINPISGVIEISTDKSKENIDKSKDSYFTEPMRTRELFIKGIYFSRTLNKPSMSFSIPIYCDSHNGEHIIGILITRVNLKPSLYALLLNRTGMGKTGETLIVNKDVLALNELRWYDNAPLKLNIKANPAIKASKGETGITEIEDYRNEKVLAAYTYIPRTKWGFVAKQDLKEVYAPIQSLLRNIRILFFLSVIVVYFIAIFLSKRITQPIVEMTKASKKIQEGNYSVRSQLRTDDELNYLSETFNNMAESISSQISTIKKVENDLRVERDSLEEQVKERTIELKQELDEHMKTEEALHESEMKYRVILASIEDSYFEVNRRGEITFFNESFSKITGYPPDELMGMKNDKYLDQENRKKVFKKFNEVWKTGIPTKLFDYELTRKNGEKRTVQTSVSLVTDENGQKIGFRGIIRDISDLKKTEEALRESEEELQNFMDSATDGFILMDSELNYNKANKTALEIIGLDRKEIIGKNIIDVAPNIKETGRYDKYIKVLKTGVPFLVSDLIPHPKFGNKHLELKAFKVSDGLGIIFNDITERKQIEKQIEASLKEKEILLQEIHHRVKNNMQIISSLLKLQASNVGDERVTDALMECRGRVQAMAYVHETLYGSDTMANIDFKIYISKITSQIFQTFKTSMDRVKLEVDAKNITLGIEQAVPLGLITNELVTNSLKYAFPENRSGEIVIHIRAVEQDSIEFVFSDNGIGIPEGLDWRNTDSLGLRLVIILADQLDGTVSLDRGKGTHFTVRFRHKENQ